MKRIKRWTASLVSGFDTVINQVENHESVIASSIRELQEAAARTKVKLNRLKRDESTMTKKVADLERTSGLWNERALKLRDSDKPKAIECLRRRKRVDAEIERLRDELPKHASLVNRIGQDVTRLQERIDELKRKKRTFSTRASRAKAIELSKIEDLDTDSDLEAVFDRWEVKLTESELCAHVAIDSLEEEFCREEEQADLELELERLSEQTETEKSEPN